MYSTAGWATANPFFTNFVTRLYPNVEARNFAFEITIGVLKDQFVNPPSDSDIEEIVDEKQHHESEKGVLFTLHRWILY
jgi:hypothetical protein